MDRRNFLGRMGGFAGVAGMAHLASGTPREQAVLASKLSRLIRPPGLGLPKSATEGLPTADWVKKENAKRGSRGWILSPKHKKTGIEGYISVTSATHGESFTLFVNTAATTWHAEIFRVGYYGGAGGRIIHVTPELKSQVQPTHTFTPGINMVECHWHPSRVITIDPDWPTGYYMIKLIGSGGEERYVPLVVRDDASHSALLVQSSVTTWQAYNQWGGYSLYGGVVTQGQSTYDTRSRIVSFDRPYTPSPLALDAQGSGDFLGNELPFVFLAERLGLDVSYWTDVDLHSRSNQLLNHKVLVSLGHDEYWSTPMRNGATTSLYKGLNLIFLGANACYRQIRFESSNLGAYRRVICYKDASEDPITKSDPALATGGSWATDPIPRPESQLIGSMYQSFGANSPMVVVDSSSFVFKGTGLKDKHKITSDLARNVVGSEFDGFEPKLAPVNDVTILAHSPVKSVSGNLHADMTYFTVPKGGGVFATGTASWVQLLWNGDRIIDNGLSFGVSSAVKPLTHITLNVLRVLGAGPASKTHPSKANWKKFYTKTAPVRLGVDVGGH